MAAGSIVIDLLLKTGAFEGDTKRAQKSWENFTGGVKAGAAVLGAAVVAAGAATTAFAVSVANQGRELQNMANLSSAGVVEFQKWAVAAKTVGIEQEKLGDIFKDTQDKIGDYIATGGGELKEFFEEIAPKVGLTAQEMAKLSGPQALGAFYNALEKSGKSQKEIVFYMESIADEATALQPLLANNGAELKRLGEEAEAAGRIMSQETVAAAAELKVHMDELSGTTDIVRNKIAEALLPVLNDFIDALLNGDQTAQGLNGTLGDFSKNNDLADWFKKGGLLAAKFTDILRGVIKAVEMIGKAIGLTIIEYDLLNEKSKLLSPLVQGQDRDDVKKNIAAKQSSYEQSRNQYTSEMTAKWFTNDTERAYLANQSVNGLISAGKNSPLSSSIAKMTAEANRSAAAQSLNARETEKATKAKEKEVKAMTAAEAKTVQRLQALAYKQNWAEIEKQQNLPKGLLAGVIGQESRGVHRKSNGELLTSPVGAKGLGQFMPDTRKWAMQKGWGDAYDENQAATVTAKYLRYLLDKFDGNVKNAVNAYNWGDSRVEKQVKKNSDWRPEETNGHWAGTQKWQSLFNGGDGKASDTMGVVMAERMVDLSVDYLEQQRERLMLLGKETEQEKLLAEIKLGKYGDLADAQKAEMVRVAGIVDKANELYITQERVNGMMEEATGTKAIKQYYADIELLNTAMTKNQITAEQYVLTLSQINKSKPDALKTDFEKNWSSTKQWLDDANDVQARLDQGMAGWLQSGSDALAEFVTTGKLNFRDFTVSILQDLAKIAMQKAIAGIVGNIFGDVGGASLTGAVGFDSGGYTGDGGKFEPAGIVHKGEGVLNQSEIRALGGEVGFNQLRRNIAGLRGHASGGMAGRPMLPKSMETSSGQSIQMTNYITLESSGDSEADGVAIAEGLQKKMAEIADGRAQMKITTALRPGGDINNAIKGRN